MLVAFLALEEWPLTILHLNSMAVLPTLNIRFLGCCLPRWRPYGCFCDFIFGLCALARKRGVLWQRKEKNSRCMMRKPIEFFLIIIMCAIITFGLRALPFAIFRGERKMPVWLEQLGKELPPLIMAVLIVYCLRDIMTDPKHIGIAQMAGVLATAISYKWKHNTLLSIISGTAVYICMIFVI